jgi:hypothetical protein
VAVVLLLRVVRHLPSAAGVEAFAQVQWAGVGQESREKTAGYFTVVGLNCRVMGI